MKYGFLFHMDEFPNPCITGLLQDEKFVRILDSMIEQKHHITSEDVYECIKILYYPKWRANERTTETGLIRTALKKYSKKHLGDPSVWEQEFIELDESGATEY